MVWWIGGGVVAGLLVLVGAAWCARAAWRVRVGHAVARERERLIRGQEPTIRPRGDGAALAETFRKEYLIRTENFLDDASLERLRQEALDNLPRLKRGFVPTHKQGGTLSYELMHHHAPGCLALYHSEKMLRWVSDVVGEQVRPAGDHDQSACSILYYTQEGDYINWHYDPNFYYGRQFTILIVLVNKSANGGLSSSNLVRRLPDGREEVIEADVNTLVLFEGVRWQHRVSPASAGDTRIILSMTLNTTRRISLVRELARRVKDTAFYGLPVLWE
jgi:hypothetical protein